MVNADEHHVVCQVSCCLTRGMLQMCIAHGMLPDTCNFHDLMTCVLNGRPRCLVSEALLYLQPQNSFSAAMVLSTCQTVVAIWDVA